MPGIQRTSHFIPEYPPSPSLSIPHQNPFSALIFNFADIVAVETNTDPTPSIKLQTRLLHICGEDYTLETKKCTSDELGLFVINKNYTLSSPVLNEIVAVNRTTNSSNVHIALIRYKRLPIIALLSDLLITMLSLKQLLSSAIRKKTSKTFMVRVF